MARVADVIMDRLFAEGVRHLFTVTGRGTLFLTDALAKKRELTGVFVHHEQAAAYAAVAYAQTNDALGACLVSTGCASTNAITGVLSAWQDGIPCVFISGQNTLKETTRHTGIALRTYGQQEADIVSMVKPICKYAVMITSADQIAYELDKAFHLARTGRKGPVWIDVPLDVQAMRVEPDRLARFNGTTDDTGAVSPADVEAVAELLSSAERPVLLVGSGVRSAGAIPALNALLAAHPVPVVYPASAPDVLGATHPLCVGSVGAMACSRAGAFAVQNADALVVLGHRLTALTTGTDRSKFARHARTVVVDIDPVEHTKESVRIDRLVTADVRAFLEALTTRVQRTEPQLRAPAEWLARCAHWKTLFPPLDAPQATSELVDLYGLAGALSRALPHDAVFLTDSGFCDVILPTNVQFGPGMRCIHPAQQGAMGFALPAILGAHFARGAPVVAAMGDGSIMMNLQELQTLAALQVPAKILVLNNNVYGIIRRRQAELFRNRTIGTDPSNGVTCPDFARVAAAFGIAYRRIDGKGALDAQLADVLAAPGLVLCEIMMRHDQQYIEMSVAKAAAGTTVRRPLEDQAPFLDRALFLKEMIVPPIDQ